ncbi:unnamed protein product [Anisakis simplex]|uniref:Secreted protein n=1 Tax=Anisakis simplex TaxID=6269 RepID=A0A0M3JQ55_ANISI|nr:unnamed protein product [Anisakis simplex]
MMSLLLCTVNLARKVGWKCIKLQVRWLGTIKQNIFCVIGQRYEALRRSSDHLLSYRIHNE